MALRTIRVQGDPVLEKILSHTLHCSFDVLLPGVDLLHQKLCGIVSGLLLL